MSSYDFIGMFPEERTLSELIIHRVREKEGLEEPVEIGTYKPISGNLPDILQKLQGDYSRRFREVVGTITDNENYLNDSFLVQYPLTVNILWKGHRMNLGGITLLPKSYLDVGKSNSENDQRFSTAAKLSLELGERDGCLDEEPQLELLGRQPERVGGIGIYVFKNLQDDYIRESVWDLRQEEVPRLNYSG